MHLHALFRRIEGKSSFFKYHDAISEGLWVFSTKQILSLRKKTRASCPQWKWIVSYPFQLWRLLGNFGWITMPGRGAGHLANNPGRDLMYKIVKFRTICLTIPHEIITLELPAFYGIIWNLFKFCTITYNLVGSTWSVPLFAVEIHPSGRFFCGEINEHHFLAGVQLFCLRIIHIRTRTAIFTTHKRREHKSRLKCCDFYSHHI